MRAAKMVIAKVLRARARSLLPASAKECAAYGTVKRSGDSSFCVLGWVPVAGVPRAAVLQRKPGEEEKEAPEIAAVSMRVKVHTITESLFYYSLYPGGPRILGRRLRP